MLASDTGAETRPGKGLCFPRPLGMPAPTKVVRKWGGDGNPRGLLLFILTLWVNHLRGQPRGLFLIEVEAGQETLLASRAAKDKEEEYHNCVINSPMFADFLV